MAINRHNKKSTRIDGNKINELIAGQEQVAKKKKYTKTTTRIKNL